MSLPAQQQPAAKPLPKVLRIGVVREGKVAAERLMRIGEPVHVGDGPKATFPVVEPRLQKVHELFVPLRDTYVLSVPEWVEGRVQWRDGIQSLEELRAEGQKKGDLWQLTLNENVKGKIVVGDTTFLFQFVPAPPEPVRQVTAADFRPRLFDDDDPLFLGLLGSFTVVAAAFLTYVYFAPMPERSDLDRIADAQALIVDKIEQVKVPEKRADAGDKGKEEKAEKPKEEKAAPKEEAAEEKAQQAAAPTAESVVKKSFFLQQLGTTGRAGGDMVSDLIGDDAAASGSLDAALAGVTGVQNATAEGLAMKKAQGGNRGDASVGVAAGAAGSATTGGAATVTVKAKVNLGSADSSVDEGDAGNIPATVRKYKGKIESCMQQELRTNPKLAGRVAIGWQVDKGRVSNVHVVSNDTGSQSLGNCISNAVRGMRFDESLTATVDSFPWVLSGE